MKIVKSVKFEVVDAEFRQKRTGKPYRLGRVVLQDGIAWAPSWDDIRELIKVMLQAEDENDRIPPKDKISVICEMLCHK